MLDNRRTWSATLLIVAVAVFMASLNAAYGQKVAVNEDWIRVEVASDNARAHLVGTWRRVSSDGRSSLQITLHLRSDGTYTKSFLAVSGEMGGIRIGGTHDGTWEANGTVVSLSGGVSSDGKHYDPMEHDLKEFHKVAE